MNLGGPARRNLGSLNHNHRLSDNGEDEAMSPPSVQPDAEETSSIVEDSKMASCHENGSRSTGPEDPPHAAVSREHVQQIMREQDAELLASLQQNDGSATEPAELPTAPPPPPGTPRKAAFVRRSSRTLEEETTTNATCPKDARRALSGEVWILKGGSVDVSGSSSHADDADKHACLAAQPQKEEAPHTPMHRTDSMNRRLCEAAQFAEAVGDLPPSEGDDFMIIEEAADDDDDDDDDDVDATEIHVAPATRTPKTESRDVTEEGRKNRPQWPFAFANNSSRCRAGIFLDKLPEGSACQDFVYKGIQSNPPEIVKRGTARGNYAQLHRKAWLEVSDKYHRYGKHLRLYYRHWESLGCPTNMFFDWLDSKGEAAGQSQPELEECPRSVLDSDTVLYIPNQEVTDGYAITFSADENGHGRAVDVDGDPVTTGVEGWIFVLRDGVMYGTKKVTSVLGRSKQRFHHSSFFSGKAVAAAGIFITDKKGRLTRLYPHSGHYRPGEAHMQRVLFHLHHSGVDLRTFETDLQQILHVARDKEPAQEKKKKVESLQLVPAVTAACFLAHKARFIGEGVYVQIRKIRQADVATVSEALALLD